MPDASSPPARVRVGSESELRWSPVSGRLELALWVAGIDAAGWLAVQWLAPDGSEAASQSAWLTATPDGAPVRQLIVSPQDVALGAGEWRALVSWQGRLLRQFRVAVPASE